MANLSIKSEYAMLSGYKIPALGFGVYQTPAEVAEEVVLHSFKAGYRHVRNPVIPSYVSTPDQVHQIDSARVYRNEGPCSEAIKKSGIPRSEIFFTSKVPPRSMGYDQTKASISSSFSQTGLDYIDFAEARRGTWRALVEAQQAGQIRSIGVSNYGVHHLDELESYIQELESQNGKGKGGEISVGQWELHPWLARPDIVSWCQKRGVVVQAYCPIVRGQRFEEPVLQPLVKKYGKTPSQVLLRWSLQKGFVPLPKSVTPSRIDENADIFDFNLNDEEMKSLETGEYAPCAWDPTTSDD
ncbi:MAG: hypothetical protein Q9200_001023 [Gallowayella weberi]